MEPAEASVPYQLEALIVTAFVAARDRGKPEWRRMTVAVLKNRLLQLSHHEFHERRHGAASIRELLERYPALVRVDDQTVELLASVPVTLPGTGPVTDTVRTRIRSDLWRAIMDFASGRKYAWDASDGRAREAVSGDNLSFPTLTREEFAQWRAEFAAAHSSEDLSRWRDEALGTKDLPQGLRAEWSALVTSRVAKRLTDWFAAAGIEPPTLTESVSIRRVEDLSVERLREVVAGCVSVMTADELNAIPLPPAAVLRAKLGGRL